MTSIVLKLRDLLTAWYEGLLLWVGPALRARLMPASPRIVFQQRDGLWHAWAEGLQYTQTETGEAVDRLKADHRQWPASLRVEPHEVLQVPLVMPLASFDHLCAAAQFEIEQVTPFALEDVVFDVRCDSVDATGGVLHALLVVMPRDRFLTATQSFASAHSDMSLFGLDVGDAVGHLEKINLLPPALRAHALTPNAWRRIAWGTVTVALLALGLWRSVDNARTRADVTEQRVQSRQVEARRVAAEEARLNALVSGANNVLQKQKSRKGLLALSNALAERLPPGVHVERFELQGTQLQVTGLGSDAATVMARLQGAPGWGVPVVVGGTSTNPLDGRERFSIALPLKQEAAR